MPATQPEQKDDAELVRQAKSGNTYAFAALYERYATDIYRFIKAQVPDTLEAEDLTSDVFLRAWHSLRRYRERGYPFSAYLYKIARNILIDHWRSKKKKIDSRSLQIETFEDQFYIDDERLKPTPDSPALWQVLNEIREDYRSVLVLRFMVGLSPAEIAVIMHRSEGAVRVLQHRAVAAVRRLLTIKDLDDEI